MHTELSKREEMGGSSFCRKVIVSCDGCVGSILGTRHLPIVEQISEYTL